MIKGISSGGPYITIQSNPLPYISMHAPSAGIMRYNGNMACVEIYDGTFWNKVNNFDEINLSTKTIEILEWAHKKMNLEKEAEQLSNTNPTVKIAFENLKRAEEQLQITIHLSKEYDNTTTS